ncbi:ABC transporter-like protein [Phyllosticta capitalensis]|uniref:ABC transporter-like protein n=2 Tax=Phyllosticta capitalensis TaxID=121624 RepID=A0ABR1YE29_9PEZI
MDRDSIHARYHTRSLSPPVTPTDEKTGSFSDSDNAHSKSIESGSPSSSQKNHHWVAQHEAVNTISLREVAPITVRVRNLTVVVDVSSSNPASVVQRLFRRKGGNKSSAEWKPILDNISADMPSGSLTAIIGGSGSGKTTMLNVMSNRMGGRRLEIKGQTLFNGQQKSHNVDSLSAYVTQQDVLIPTLTVRETLQYAADLRLPSSVNEAERARVVEEVILELGLKEAADTQIGSEMHKGCSGGEKRRVSIGVQLLANPSVLFLDEPTTGLDATSAFQLVRTLKNLASQGRTIITTIHQPRSEIWNLFDNLVILTKGCPAYSGPAAEALPFFEGLGYELPTFVNPAEFLIDLAAVDQRTPDLEQTSLARVGRIKAAWRERETSTKLAQVESMPETIEISDEQSRLKIGELKFFREVWVLTRRTWVVTIRDPLGMLGSLFEAIVMAIICGYIFFQLGEDAAGIKSRQGAMYTASALQGYLILQFEIYRLTGDIQVFDRERGEGVVSVPGFLLSRRLARLIIEDVPVPLIFSLIFYFMAGFRNDTDQFFTFFGIILFEQYIAVCLAMVCISLSRNFAGASLFANMIYTLQSMACGYFVPTSTMPVYVQWTKWTAYVFYAFGALLANEFADNFYDCPDQGGPSNPACREYEGNFIMSSLGFPSNWVWRPAVVLLAFVIAFYFGAGFILRFWKAEINIAKSSKDVSDDSAGKEKMTARSLAEVRTVTLRLDEFALEIEKRNCLGMKSGQIDVLKPVTTEFEPGVLNIIMGPSGSGKTTLLNSIGRRLKNDFTTKYHPKGLLLVNHSIPSDSVIKSIISYVTQDDEGLLPSLTVRETLRFAAGLRLPRWMPKEEKNKRAEDILIKMGLKDCADNMIGGEFVKGISGGEKRRVTIAIQCLTDPRILLLDEPTSGLDAFTAASIMEVLRGLAEEGRTLIMTIHQARSDLFHHFGNVLLLSRGGHPVYAGQANGMVPHFSALGYDCPRSTNPADFALDLITIDLQHVEREAASREKVASIVASWSSRPKPPSKDPNASPLGTAATPAELGSLARTTTPFHIAYPILVRRAFLNFSRQPNVIAARVMQVVGLGIILALFFAPLGHDYASVQSRIGFVLEIPALYFVGMLQNVATYPSERDVFAREHDDGAYSVEAFFAQYCSLEIPFLTFASLLFSLLTALSTYGVSAGAAHVAQLYFVYAFNAFCIVSCGESVGIAFNTLFAHTGFAVNITSVFLSVAQVMSGVMSINMPEFLQAMNWLSPAKYAVANLAPYSLRGVRFDCAADQRGADGQCIVSDGEQVLKLYKLDHDPGTMLAALGACTVVYRAAAYLLLKARRERWGRKAAKALFEGVVTSALGRRMGVGREKSTTGRVSRRDEWLGVRRAEPLEVSLGHLPKRRKGVMGG